MPRIQVHIPDQFLFETEIAIRVSDLNYGGHVGNDTILTLMQEARVQYYRSLGFKDEVDIDGPVGQIISDVAVQYKAETFLGDTLVVKLAINEISKYGFDMMYVLLNKTSHTEVARGKTGIVCFDYEKRKVASIPSVLLDKINNSKV